METTSVNIYIDIDSLFDIRQAILKKFYSLEELAKLVMSEEYAFRQIDKFNIDMDLYEEEYRKRNYLTIKESIISYTFNQLRGKILKHSKTATVEHKTKGIFVYLNVYPFNLTNRQAYQLAYVLEYKLQTAVSVVPVNIPTEDLTPLLIRNYDFKDMFIYETSNWFNAQNDALTKMSVRDTVIYFPALIKKEPTEEEKKKLKETGFSDIFSLTEFIASPHATILFNPVIYYNDVISASALIKKFLKKDSSLEKLLKDTPL
jgi:hypothetical protein